jgi:hypothetical protein
MRRSPGSRLPLQPQTEAPPPSLPGSGTDSPHVKGMSRWRALDRKQFRELIASPVRKDRPEGGPTSC